VSTAEAQGTAHPGTMRERIILGRLRANKSRGAAALLALIHLVSRDGEGGGGGASGEGRLGETERERAREGERDGGWRRA
jgi:hypothetical protein